MAKPLHKISYYTVLGLTLLIIAFRFSIPARNTLSWDVMGYYMYLPATFIYDDVKIKDKQWVDDIIEKYKPTATFYQAVKQDDGTWVLRYTSGLALINSPFFFAGHAAAGVLGYPQDGFSLPYQWAMVIGALFYSLLGLWLCRKLLLLFFNDSITALLLLILVLGTNYFQIVVYAGTMPHSYLFTFYIILLLQTIKWHKTPNYRSAIAIGLMVGLITLIRPNELVVILIPLLWGITGFNKTIIEKLKLVLSKFSHVIVLAIAVIVGGYLQLFYWKHVTGNWLYYSYQDPGVGFDFKSPHTLDFLFSFRKGWFIYTPLMFLSILGFYFLWIKNRAMFWGFLAYFIINLYIVSSWSVWWYAGGSYSSRSLVSAYGLLLIPMGYLFQVAYEKRKILFQWLFMPMIGLFFVLNLFQTWQFNTGILHGERVTRAYYFRIFGKTSITDEDRKLMLVERSTETIEIVPTKQKFKLKVLSNFNWNNPKEEGLKNWNPFGYNSKGSFEMNENVEFSPGINMKYSEITDKEYAWIRASVRVFVPSDSKGGFPLLAMAFHHKDAAYKYRSSEYLNHTLEKGKWNLVTLEYQTPEVRSIEDNLKVYVWNRDKQNVFIDDLRIECLEPVDD
jgi:hypothetical protein